MRFKLLTFFCLFTARCFGSDLLHEMSLEEKVGQILMVHFQGETINDDAKALIQEIKVGSIIYYNWSNGLNSPDQVKALSEGLQQLAKENRIPIPLLIATDQEGGVVTRLQSGFTFFPGNRALGETSDPNLAKLSALIMGQELQAVGINMNLAPVVDVNNNPRNPIIGIRSFGETPEIVIRFAEKALEGYKKAGIIATLKHFPGHGDTEIDSHEDLPIIRKSLEELEKIELVPFMQLSKIAPVIMTAHLLVPALDVDHCSTLSEKTLSYLRNKIGFQGVIITDSLVMQGVLKKCEIIDEAAIHALNAGSDILLIGGRQLIDEHRFELNVNDIKRIHASLVKAVQENRISERRLNQAVQRVLSLKEEYILSKKVETPLNEPINTSAHKKIAEQIAFQALKITKKVNSSISNLRDKKIFIIAPKVLKDHINQTSLLQISQTTNSWFFDSHHLLSIDIDCAKQNVLDADILLICSYNAWKNPSQINLIQTLMNIGKPVILICTRDSLDATLFPNADLIIRSFSPSVPSIQAVSDQLKEKYL